MSPALAKTLREGTRSERYVTLGLLRRRGQADPDVLAVLEELGVDDPYLRVESLGTLLRLSGPRAAWVHEIVQIAESDPTVYFNQSAEALRAVLVDSPEARHFIVDHLAVDTSLPHFDDCKSRDRTCWVALSVAIDGGNSVGDRLWEIWGTRQATAPLAVRLCGTLLDPARWECGDALAEALRSESDWVVGFACQHADACEGDAEEVARALADVVNASGCYAEEAARALARMGGRAHQVVVPLLQHNRGAASFVILLRAIGDHGEPEAWAGVVRELLRKQSDAEGAQRVEEVLRRLLARRGN
jgi:hypothetical protein